MDYYNGESSYTVVQGTDEKGEQLIVWVPEKKGETIVRKKSEGISEKRLYKERLNKSEMTVKSTKVSLKKF